MTLATIILATVGLTAVTLAYLVGLARREGLIRDSACPARSGRQTCEECAKKQSANARRWQTAR